MLAQLKNRLLVDSALLLIDEWWKHDNSTFHSVL